jgi:hypothetical protein
MGMFSFADGYMGLDDDGFYKSKAFLAHASGVLGMLDAVVTMLGPDLEPLALALFDLGATHLKFGVLPAHYEIVGEALLCTLATALGDKWTPAVKKGWAGIYTFISSNMILGADNYLTEQKRERKIVERKAKMQQLQPRSARSTKLLSRRASPDSSATSSGIRRRASTNSCTSPMSSDPARIRPMEKSQRASRAQRLSSTSTTTPTDNNSAHEVLGPADSSSIVENQQPKRVSLDPDGSTSSTEALSCATEATTDTDMVDHVDYSRMVIEVSISWDIVKRIPNYCEVAGVLLFKK